MDATINSSITQEGARSTGIYAAGLGFAPVMLRATGNITSSGDSSIGIYSVQELLGPNPDAFINVRSDGAITMTGRNATGARLDNYITPDESLEEIFGYPYFSGESPVSATFNGDVKSTGAGGRAIEVLGSDVTLKLNGVTLGGADSAERTGAGVVVRASNGFTITNTGSLSSMNLAAVNGVAENGFATLINKGEIAGAVWLNGAEGANFRNDGKYWTAGLNMSPGGVLQNNGFVGLIGSAPGAANTTIAADVLNAGTISLVNGVAGDQLSIGASSNMNARNKAITQTYDATGDARLAVDAQLTSSGVSDMLRLTGDVSGVTKIAVANTARGASVITPTFIPVVTGVAGAASDAFALQNGPIASGVTDWTLEKRGDQFGLASSVNASRAGDVSRVGSRTIDLFNLVQQPGAGGAGGAGGSSSSAVLNFAPTQPPGYPQALANFGANASTAEAGREASAVAHLGAVHQRARVEGDDTAASAVFGGLDIVWGPLTGRALRITAGVFGGYSTGSTDMAGGSRSVAKANTYGARLRYDAEGWFVGAAARLGVGDLKYTMAGAQGKGDTLFHAFDAFMGKRFDMGGDWYVQPPLAFTYAKADSNTFDVGGAPMCIGVSESRTGGEMRIGRDNIFAGASGWTVDGWLSGGVWRSLSDGSTQFAILALAPPSNGTIWSYGGGLAVKAPRETVTMRLGAFGQAGAVQSFTIYGGVSVPFGG